MSAPSASTAAAAPERILRRLDWKVIRRLDGALQGDYSTLFYGAGVDLSDLREYQPQDDIRHIDWNVTARMNRLHVRQYLEDRELTTWFLLDLSRSMRFGGAERNKHTVLVEFVGVMARLLTRGGNRVGAILYDTHTTRSIPARTGRNQVLRLLHDLLRQADRPGRGRTDLKVLLYAALGALKRRSLLFVVSDFISEPGWQRPLSLLGHRHELVTIRVWDPRESQLPSTGFVYIEDAETGEQIAVDTGDPIFRRNLAALAARNEADLRTALTRASTDPHSISTEDDLGRAILRMAALRKKRRR
ncbi:MAG TPA: DUF58 domain-containing protein [Anaerolineales bacterium]|nr:DUF58 domain-containing protein [Anaerolineales bacterium]